MNSLIRVLSFTHIMKVPNLPYLKIFNKYISLTILDSIGHYFWFLNNKQSIS